ncbi:hypothetical protein [Oharaeibacter diazotrophicus]|uniref:Uncharacterized protein n=1 Tax=Oharaeibacter diazotrophicus TaxID=1920512 RepID=A0A4R6RNK9_9HYPH|nr:hypothetical protein [Oharaeibacter diazotrophicus]TDP87765.1 hypothetical protein EDD54_1664 [Oharaeibacter diazotrophicus]BBE74653.1 hypothetical protein OHA_1_04288 [Pleomorphomonas sp. SM30]GLS77029.1 hypothetical protein GCM10007904_23660 [Oharaeibacter diazotrophicus]
MPLKSSIFGFASLGALTGALLIFSSTPIAGTLLPLLFGLTAAVGAFGLSKADLGKPENRDKIELVSKSAGALFVACLVTGILSVAIKPAVIAHLNPPPETPIDVSDSPDVAKAVALRAKMLRLGATNAEIAAAVKAKADPAVLDQAIKLLGENSLGAPGATNAPPGAGAFQTSCEDGFCQPVPFKLAGPKDGGVAQVPDFVDAWRKAMEGGS